MALPRTRTLRANAQGAARVDESGSWLEIVDGGFYGWQNTIELRCNDDLASPANAHQVACMPGTVFVGDFDELILTVPAAFADQVVVRTGFGPPPTQLTGKPRVRWLARGVGVSIAPGTPLAILDWTAQTREDYDTTERHGLLEWIGFVISAKSFALYSSVRANPTTPSAELVCQKFAVYDHTGTLPTGLSLAGRYASHFEQLTAGTNTSRAPVMPNTAKLWLANIDVASGTFSYIVGVRG